MTVCKWCGKALELGNLTSKWRHISWSAERDCYNPEPVEPSPAVPQAPTKCKYGDPYCPCQDGDPCHYEGEKPMPMPAAQTVPIPEDLSELHRIALAAGREMLVKIPQPDLIYLIERIGRAEATVAELVSVLRRTRQKLGIIDNGHCAVCGFGYRNWKLPHCKEPDGPCSNENCLSRRIEAAIARATGKESLNGRRGN